MRGVRRAALWLLGAGLAPGAGPLRAQTAGGAGAPAEAPGEVVVRSAPSRRGPTEIVLGGREAARGAGTQGDPAKALQSLPGFGRGGPGGGELIAWGSSPAESRVFVDGVEVPALYHGDGVRSVVPASLVRDLRASPGAYGPAYGRALGGVVRLTTEAPAADGPHLRAGADALDGRAEASLPLGRGAVLAASGRYGWVDRLLPALALDAGGLIVVPRYADAQAQAAFALRPGERLRAVALASRDEYRRSVGGDDPAARRGDVRRASFERAYLRYERSLPGGASVELTPFVGRDRSSAEASFGPGPPTRLARSALRYGARAEYAAPLGDAARVALGLDASGAASEVERAGSPSRPAREGDPYAFGAPPGDAYDADRYRVNQLGVAPFAALDLALGPLRVSPALRFDTYLLEVERLRPALGRAPPVGDSSLVAAPEPRLALRYAVSGALEAFAAGGRYHQPPAPEDLSAVFGNPRLGLASATHLSAGERLALGAGWQLEALGFVKWLDGIAARAPAAAPPTARLLEARGAGRAYGASWMLRRRPGGGWFGWLSATLSRSERRDDPALAARLSDHDQPLVAAASFGRELGPWTLGARLRYASGAPRTPVVGAFGDLRSGRWQPLFGATNAARLPPFAQLDLRVDRAFALGAGAALRLSLDVLNVTARANAEEVVYASDFRSRAYFTGLPTLAVLGAELER